MSKYLTSGRQIQKKFIAKAVQMPFPKILKSAHSSYKPAGREVVFYFRFKPEDYD